MGQSFPATRAIVQVLPGAHDRSTRALQVCQAMGSALAISLAQILLAWLLSGQASLTRPNNAYLALLQWDSGWYTDIATNGYRYPVPPHPADCGNVAFFPGYPLGARCLGAVLGLSVRRSLLVFAQFACWGFWTYLILIFQRWRVSRSLAALGILGVLTHPAAFFLVAGYSESFFLMTLLGFLYWTDGTDPVSRFLAAVHGFLMTATRIVGLALVIYPLCQEWFRGIRSLPARQRLRRAAAPVLLALIASLGGLLYFGYCYHYYGRWDLYRISLEHGWGVRPNYLALFSTNLFDIGWPDWSQNLVDPQFLSRLSVPAMLLLFIALASVEWRLRLSIGDTAWRQRLGFYLCGGLMFYISLSGYTSLRMPGMTRYSLCIQVMLMLALVHLLAHVQPHFIRRRVRLAALFLIPWGVISFAIQVALSYRFTHGEWVA